MSSENRKLKDYSAEVATALPEYRATVESSPSKLAEVLDQLLALEKKCRLGADAISTAKIVECILDLVHQQREWDKLNEMIAMLAKRRAQLQKVQETIVHRAAAFVDSAPDTQTRRALIEAIRSVAEGKIFVELERARLTRQLAAMDEAAGDVSKAADIMQEVQVETIGQMEAKEKLDFLFEQIRLCLRKKDFVRAEIIAKKVDAKALKAEEMEAERRKFSELMIQYHTQFGNYREIAEAYYQIYRTAAVQEAESQWKPVLTRLVLFAMLAPFDSEVSDLISRIRVDRNLDSTPALSSLLDAYIADEVMSWPLDESQRKLVESESDAFGPTIEKSGFNVATKSTEAIVVHDRSQRWRDLHKRIVQHNVRVIAQYYEEIRTARLGQLLGLSVDEVEFGISELVTLGQLHAKIDRPDGVVSFVRPTETEIEAIDDFASRIDSLLKLVDDTCHAINKEIMVHQPTVAAGRD